MRRFLATLGGLLLAVFAWLAALGAAILIYGT